MIGPYPVGNTSKHSEFLVLLEVLFFVMECDLYHDGD